MARLSLLVALAAGVLIAVNLVAGQNPPNPVYCGNNDDCLGKLSCPGSPNPPCCHGQLESYSDEQTVYAIRNGTCTCCKAPTPQCTLIYASAGGPPSDTDAQALQQGCAKPGPPMGGGAGKKQ